MAFTFETFVTFVISTAIVTGNVLIMLVLFCTEQMTHVNKYFFSSLTMSDLLIGVFFASFSVWASLFDSWIYGETFCHIEAYLAAIFWIASLYSLMWVTIDHYVAVRKPDRYESIMTKTRCVCWVAFIWLAAICFCCPPLFGVAQARYYSQAFICIIDWNLQKAYFITSGLMIIIPPMIALTISNCYIFTAQYHQNKLVFEKCSESNSRPEFYFMNSIVCVVYIVSWLPWCILQLYEMFQQPADSGYEHVHTVSSHGKLHYYLMWIAIGNSFWKFLIYLYMDHDFRIGIKILYAKFHCTRWIATN